jgi:hypothetical protein
MTTKGPKRKTSSALCWVTRLIGLAQNNNNNIINNSAQGKSREPNTSATGNPRVPLATSHTSLGNIFPNTMADNPASSILAGARSPDTSDDFTQDLPAPLPRNLLVPTMNSPTPSSNYQFIIAVQICHVFLVPAAYHALHALHCATSALRASVGPSTSGIGQPCRRTLVVDRNTYGNCPN